MRNLKKILALALALSMMFSMMVSASAAFTDADQIDADYAEAVEVLSGLGVFKGYTAGDFKPKGTITREEVAAIIYRIATGDVKDEKAALYVGTANFSDVKATDWSAGYIGYCANAGYVKGMGDGTFAPQGKVTGMQALAMVLRALGYDAQGEFTGLQWESNIARVATQKGILKGVNPGVLSQPASRELVAQLLFAAIAKTNTVAYNLVLGYQENKTTLGYDTFKLVELDGVLTANEYADLYGTSVLDAGEIAIDDVDYNWAGTTLAQIGLAVEGWAADDDVLYLVEGTNKVEEYTAYKLLSKFDMDVEEDAEYFLNYSNTFGDVYTADAKIKYVIQFKKADLTVAADKALKEKLADNKGSYVDANGFYTYTKEIKAGAKLTDVDYAYIKDIFTGADKVGTYELGEVYVYTTSEGGDISDTMKFSKFVKEYLITESAQLDKVTSNENGNLLKAIDNDGDGDADLVLKVTYTMAAVTDVDGSDYEVSTLDSDDDEIWIDGDDLLAEETFVEEDVIVYTLIDGLYTANLAEVVTAEVDYKGIDFKDETITCGEDTYEQSYITMNTEKSFNASFMYDDFEFDILNATPEVKYDFYMDNYGYIRAYTENKHDYGFGLLTDGYYKTNGKTESVKVDMVVGAEAEAEFVVSTNNNFLTAQAWEAYIDMDDEGDKGSRDTWGRLIAFKDTTNGAWDKFQTNVAAYAVNEENISLYDVDNFTNRELDTIKEELKLYSTTGLKTKTLETLDGDRVYATNDTVYYYVTTSSKGDLVTESWTGYANAPSDLSLVAGKDYAYVVATETKVGTGYYYADVIVIEAVSEKTNVRFVHFANTRTAETDSYWVKAIEYVNDAWEKDSLIKAEAGIADGVINFYEITVDGEIADPNAIKTGFADWYIFAAEAQNDADIYDRDYVHMVGTDGNAYFKPATTPVYKIKIDTDYNVWMRYSLAACDIDQGDRLVYVTNSSGTVQYVINVEQSLYAADADKIADDVIPAAVTLYELIVEDAKYVPSGYEAAVDAALNAASEADLDDALVLLNALDTTKLSAEQKAYVAELKAGINTKKGTIDTMETAVYNAINTKAQAETVTIGAQAEVLADDETTISLWGYTNVKSIVDVWAGKIAAGEAKPYDNSNLSKVAKAYVDALKVAAGEAQNEQFKALATGKAEAFMTKIENALKAPAAVTFTGSKTLAAEIDAFIAAKGFAEYSDAEYTLTIDAGDFESGVGATGTKTVEVKISVTNKYDVVTCDPVVKTIAVTVAW